MTYLNRSLYKLGLVSVVVGMVTVSRAETTIHKDTTIVSKDTVVLVTTVPDSLIRERLAKLQKTIPLNYHTAVQGYIDLFVFRRPAYAQTMLERMPLFFPLYERFLKEYGLPDELKYLSIVESALDPRAVSRSGAGGLWQFMPGTGREMRLYQDDYIDERMDPVKATEAACKYLRDLYNIFEDWELAMAAYNCGPGAVKRAMRRTGGDSFYTIYDALPKETRGYVPLFVTFTYMMNYANEHDIVAQKYEYPIPHDTVQITGYFNLETFAKHSMMPLADLRKMNPAITTTILPDYTNRYSLRVPRQQYSYFATNRRAIMDSASRLPYRMDHVLLAHTEDVRYGTDSMGIWTSLNQNPLAKAHLEEAILASSDVDSDTDEEETRPAVSRKLRSQTYTVRKGDNLGDIADRYEVDIDDLKHWNQLSSTTLQPGQELVIGAEVEARSERLVNERKEQTTRKKEVAVKAKQYKIRYHQVQRGDTLWNIVRRYDLTIEQLKKMNHIKNDALRPGQKLIVG
ncbi:lytic transglycosylase domain-containing protein [Spirosoma luteum]|uniref:lytic transglycosylase domain-containing protein n=1 Tax=Spirosoma luteum TaxID=431553 RepID=UPI00036C7BA0|nr:lytic transglycosylase domain-containing protein [Spirosoma luteum]